MTSADLLATYDRRVPRYTSYPTADQFSASVGARNYGAWLAALPEGDPVSLYLHVPFCESLCLYCGCNTAVVRGDAPRRAYAAALAEEVALVSARIGRRPRVAEIHWGGGTPTALPADCLVALAEVLRRFFGIDDRTKVSVEIDPRHLPDDRLQALAAMNVTRASLGVQDTDPDVQRAVGRVQPLATVERCVARLRGIGVASVNCDLIYGLPHQTEHGVARTAREIAAIGADRVAAFGYAHVPWMKKHQRLLPEAALPGAMARFAQRAAIEEALTAAGYRAIGLDHFALPGDALSAADEGRALRRNFQGYTADPAPVLLGLGASSIGQLPQGYAQNHRAVPDYARAVRSGQLATGRGIALTEEDRLRRDVIEAIMCRGGADLLAIARAHAADPAPLLRDAASLEALAVDGLVELRPGRLDVTPAGRPFLRTVAAMFDPRWRPDAMQHARAV